MRVERNRPGSWKSGQEEKRAVCRNRVGKNRHADGTYLEVNLAFDAQNWTAGDICQNSLCVMWVLLMN